MQPFQQRVMDEKAELDVRLERLAGFVRLSNPTYARLPMEERGRLIRQQTAMQEYSDVLAERIAAFT